MSGFSANFPRIDDDDEDDARSVGSDAIHSTRSVSDMLRGPHGHHLHDDVEHRGSTGGRRSFTELDPEEEDDDDEVDSDKESVADLKASLKMAEAEEGMCVFVFVCVCVCARARALRHACAHSLC